MTDATRQETGTVGKRSYIQGGYDGRWNWNGGQPIVDQPIPFDFAALRYLADTIKSTSMQSYYRVKVSR